MLVSPFGFAGTQRPQPNGLGQPVEGEDSRPYGLSISLSGYVYTQKEFQPNGGRATYDKQGDQDLSSLRRSLSCKKILQIQTASLASPALPRPPTRDHQEAMKPHVVATSLAMEGLERDFESSAGPLLVLLRCFKSRARNHLQANWSLAFQFEVAT